MATLPEPPSSATAAEKTKMLTPSTPPPPKSLRKSLSMTRRTRSMSTLFFPRLQNLSLSLSLSHCTLHHDDVDPAQADADATAQSPRTRGTRADAVPWSDVLGAHVLTEDGEHLPLPLEIPALDPMRTYVFGLFAYVAKPQRSPKKLRRRRLREWMLRFPGTALADVQGLVTWINYLADPRSHHERLVAASLEDLTPTVRPPRRFLIVINPVGGAGKGVQLYEDKAAPVFRYAHIETEVRLTERAQHGEEIAEQLELGKYDCVVTVGGDGSLCEIFQGLMKRPDWKEAIRQPIGILPGGSGNGLFITLMHDAGERYKPTSAAYVLAKGVPHALDLTAVRNPHGDSMYSFLSTEWALIADIDVESEKLRALGSARFSVKTIQHLLLKKRTYEGTLWYLEEDPAAGETTPVPLDDASAGDARPGFDLFTNRAEDAPAADGSRARWRKIAAGFRLVWVMNVTHASIESHVAPGAGLSDGYNYIVLQDKSKPRTDLIKLCLALENGTHLDDGLATCIKTRAFRIEPAEPEDLICVDGEVFRGPIEGQVHHNVARLITVPSASLGSLNKPLGA